MANQVTIPVDVKILPRRAGDDEIHAPACVPLRITCGRWPAKDTWVCAPGCLLQLELLALLASPKED